MNRPKRWANQIGRREVPGTTTEPAPGSLLVRPSTSLVVARAVALHLEGKGAEAIGELEQAVSRDEGSPEIYAAIGFIQFEQKNYVEAADSYRRLLSLEPDHPTGCFNLALCLQALERWPEASEWFEKALEKDPHRTEALLGLGSCRLRLNAPRPALEAYERCLRKDPDLEAAIFGKAVALKLQRKFAEASEL